MKCCGLVFDPQFEKQKGKDMSKWTSWKINTFWMPGVIGEENSCSILWRRAVLTLMINLTAISRNFDGSEIKVSRFSSCTWPLVVKDTRFFWCHGADTFDSDNSWKTVWPPSKSHLAYHWSGRNWVGTKIWWSIPEEPSVRESKGRETGGRTGR